MKIGRGAVALALGVTLGAGAAHANYQVTGSFRYTDREFGSSGFTGAQPNVAIREADVQVVDATTLAVLANTVTDQNGQFTVQVTDTQTRNISVRALTSSSNTPTLFLTVRSVNTNAVYAVANPTITGHAPTANIDFAGSPVVAAPGAGGDAFNIYDSLLDGLNFVASLEGARPPANKSLTAKWNTGYSGGTFYQNTTRTIFLLGIVSGPAPDSDGYDDSVILHELGHYVEFQLADSDNPGGEHFLDGCYSQQLTWSEGWSTFFQNTVRQWKGLARPDLYVDTSGEAGSGHAFISYSVETPTFTFLRGSGNEVSVNAALWDIVDRPTTADNSPTTDDDALNIADGVTRAWDVHQNYIPTTSTISIEDFWDGWFARNHGFQTEMEAIFSSLSMSFTADVFEDDDSVAQARSIASSTVSTHTLYPTADQDWTAFNGVVGGTYNMSVSSVPCGSATLLRLYAANGTTLITSHPTSISHVPSSSALLYLRVTRPPDDTYGSYTLTIDITVPVTITDVEITAAGKDVHLRWRAAAQGSFSHFDVERSDVAAGPYVPRNREPVRARAGEANVFEFLDEGVRAGQRYYYRLIGVETTGEREAFGPYEGIAAIPARVVLHPARPNPFNPNTLLSFELPSAAPVWLRIYDVAGREVRALLAGVQLAAGTHSQNWNGRTQTGEPADAGVYWVHLETSNTRQVQRVILLR